LSNVVNVLQFLLNISGLELNKEKSMTYWSQKQSYKKSAWIEKFKWRWAFNGELSKMFSISFRIGLDGKEVDPFFIEKIHTKLKFENIIHLSIVDWAIVVNFVLESTMWLFISIFDALPSSLIGSNVILK
jgi:hypothetical protein